MNITIHRGVDQIGGCVTEYEYNGWRLFVDYGEQLPGTPETSVQVEGLTHGDLSRSVLLITHYHGDHVGCITDLPEELPIYIGKTAKEILGGLSEHLGHVDERQAAIYARLKYINTFSPGNLLEWGEFKIMPVIMDHSAFDAYAFRIEAGGLKVFHTGDFRTHGFRSGKLPAVIEKYVGKVDYMVCEATNVCRTANSIKPEPELQKEFIRAFTENKYNVVYLSSTNIDRLFGLYHAALKANRPFYVDGYQKKIMDIVAGRDRIWGKSRLYKYNEGHEPIVLHRDGDSFRVNEKFVDFLSDRGYVIIARGGEKFDNLLSRIPSEGRKTYLSMWNGYLDKSKAAYSPTLAKSVGRNCEYSHTSGHCDMESLENLVEMLRPKAIIPIHTDSPKTFAELFSDRWPVLIMKDGDTFRPIKDTNYDENLTAQVFAYKPLTDDIEIVENSYSLEAWSLDDRCIGEFMRKEDAIWALHHCVYALETHYGQSHIPLPIQRKNEIILLRIQNENNMNNIMIFAIGGAGCNIAEAIKEKASDKRLRDASFVFLDTDAQHLSKFEGDNNRIIRLKDESNAIPVELFRKVGSLIIVAGLGGSTTHKYLPEAVKVASSASVSDISIIATTPFLFEGEDRITKATETVSIIQNLENVRINLINNEDLVKRFPELNFINAFELADNSAMELIETTFIQ